MQNRNPSNVETLKEYVKAINYRFLRSRDLPAYEPETKTWNTGQFFLHESFGKRGYIYELREVLDEEGAFKTHGAKHGYTSEELLYFLDGWIVGHYQTLDMLGIVLNEQDEEGNTIYEDTLGDSIEEPLPEDDENEEADTESAPETKTKKKA